MPNRQRRYISTKTQKENYRTIAAIWYNKTCTERQITPKYISIRVNGNNKQSLKTVQNAIRFRINQEIKFLCIKKQKLNEQLYNAHLKCANTWNNNWQIIQQTIDNKLQLVMEAHYDKLNKKLDNLQSKCKGNTKSTSKSEASRFHPRTVNLTKIEFTKEETNLLDLGLQHSIKNP
jgi:hypothetical protein